MPGLLIAASVLFIQGAPAGSPAVVAELRPITRVWLRGEGLDPHDLDEAVRARLAGKQILGPGESAGPAPGLAALCLVRWQAGSLRLEVILGDGRVYERKISAKAAGRERTAARLIASTLASIEDETATPDRHDGVFVAPDGAPGDAEDVVEEADEVEVAVPEPTLVPAPTREVVQALPVRDRARAMEVAAGSPRPVERARVRPAPLELGVALDAGVAVGLGLPSAGLGLAGGGGALRLDLRLRRGAVLGAGFRGLALARDGLALGRFRGALVAGYVWRRRALELAATGGPTLETWQVTQRGTPVAYEASGPGGVSLLFGGLARVAAGGRISRGRTAWRVGGYVELAGSARGNGRAAQVARLDEAGAPVPVFVLGGAELSMGLEVELWVALLRRRRS